MISWLFVWILLQFIFIVKKNKSVAFKRYYSVILLRIIYAVKLVNNETPQWNGRKNVKFIDFRSILDSLYPNQLIKLTLRIFIPTSLDTREIGST